MSRPTATVLGFAFESPVMEFPVRTGPGTSFALAPFRIKKGTDKLEVLDVQPDVDTTQSNFGRVYQWFQLRFPGGEVGWMRGHVIGIQGDFSDYGYGIVNTVTHAYLLVRDMQKITTPTPPQSQPEREVSPAKPVAPDTASDVATAVKTLQVARPSGPPTAIIKTRGEANARRGPSTVGFERVFTIPRGARADILEVRREGRAQDYYWFRVRYETREAWIREDLCTYDGDTETIGLPWDLYPAPMGDNRWWVRGYNMAPNLDTSTWEHNGWDVGAPTGEPIRCGPAGGVVVQAFECRNCLPGRPNTLSHGLRIGDTAVFSDEGWGFGYGHFIIVRYNWDQLPQSTKKLLTERGFANGAVFVNYAHLESRQVKAGQELDGAAVIGSCGNTGNSEATHLHLELRASKSENFNGWASLRSGLMDPGVLFRR
jgi:hypothetical protein